MYITLQQHPEFDERIINVYSSCNSLLLIKTVIDTVEEYLNTLPISMCYTDMLDGTYLITEKIESNE